MYGNYDNISNSELCALIDEWIKGRNAARNRAILKDRLINGICYEPLAEKYELSVRHIKEIVYKNEYTLFKHL
jgi:Mor family transcriptional regulator